MMLASLASAALNRKVETDAALGAALAGNAGKTFALQLAGPARVAFRISPAGRLRPAHAAIDADCEARLSGIGAAGAPEWAVSGDAGLLKAVSALVEGCGGDLAASRLGIAARPLWREARSAGSRFAGAFRSFLESEQRCVVTRAQMAEHERDISRFERRLGEVSERTARLAAAAENRG